jgi:hypothetical protein
VAKTVVRCGGWLNRSSAKHLRSRDRTLNGALYPKIFYPEVYILEGGYCGFYRSRPVSPI